MNHIFIGDGIFLVKLEVYTFQWNDKISIHELKFEIIADLQVSKV